MSDHNYDEINLIGVELEGRWEDMPPVGELDYDGSVQFDGRTGAGVLGETIDPTGPLIGEAVSEPLRPPPALEWVEANYPDDINQTCGLHVHFSFPPPNYQLLMDRDFYDYYHDRLANWGNDHDVPDRFWRRLDGRNDTCADRWMPDEQVQGGHDLRYTQWNFQAYRAHGTAECRVMPMFDDMGLAQEAVRFLCLMVCNYLSDHEPSGVTFGVEPEPLQANTQTL